MILGKLGSSPPLALLDKVKEIALPALERGEEVCIVGKRIYALKLINGDIEFKSIIRRLFTEVLRQ